jgi:hypothetical protein
MWSYKIVKNYYTTEDELNEYGSDGWELVTVSYHRLYFKKWVEPETIWTVTLVETPEVDTEQFHPRRLTGPTGTTGTTSTPTTGWHTGTYMVDPTTGYTGPYPRPMPSEEEVVVVDVPPRPEAV